MAKRRFRGYAKKAWSNRGSYYSRARSFAGRSYGGKFGLNINMPFVAGFAAAFVAPENEMLTVGSLAAATLPVKGMGSVKGAAQGYVLGQVTQKWLLPKLGINIGNIMGQGQTTYPGSNIV